MKSPVDPTPPQVFTVLVRTSNTDSTPMPLEWKLRHCKRVEPALRCRLKHTRDKVEVYVDSDGYWMEIRGHVIKFWPRVLLQAVTWEDAVREASFRYSREETPRLGGPGEGNSTIWRSEWREIDATVLAQSRADLNRRLLEVRKGMMTWRASQTKPNVSESPAPALTPPADASEPASLQASTPVYVLDSLDSLPETGKYRATLRSSCATPNEANIDKPPIPASPILELSEALQRAIVKLEKTLPMDIVDHIHGHPLVYELKALLNQVGRLVNEKDVTTKPAI